MTIQQFEPRRSVEMISPKYGTGYRIGGGLVLTAAHLLEAVGSSCQVRSKQSFDKVTASVVWKAQGADIALVELPQAVDSCEAVVLGRLPEARTGETIAFQMYGYPLWARTQRETGTAAGGRQIEGTIYLADTSPDGLLVLEPERVPEGVSSSGSDWEGASGAAIVCEGLVIAVQHQHQNPQRPASLEATPLSCIQNEKQWCGLLQRHGISSELTIARLLSKAISLPILDIEPADSLMLKSLKQQHNALAAQMNAVAEELTFADLARSVQLGLQRDSLLQRLQKIEQRMRALEDGISQ